mgnify:CR=1 FL=1
MKKSFLKYPEIIRKYAVRNAVEKLAGKRKDISLIHVRAVLELFELRTGASVKLHIIWRQRKHMKELS